VGVACTVATGIAVGVPVGVGVPEYGVGVVVGVADTVATGIAVDVGVGVGASAIPHAELDAVAVAAWVAFNEEMRRCSLVAVPEEKDRELWLEATPSISTIVASIPAM
jgi:hypothetical protein